LANSNLALKIDKIINKIETVKDKAGEFLVRNIQDNAENMFGKNYKYPHELGGSFKKSSTVYYKKEASAVFVDHPAAFRLEYGLGNPYTLEANNYGLKAFHFKGKDGEDVFAEKITVKNQKPYSYVRNAINKTLKDIDVYLKEGS